MSCAREVKVRMLWLSPQADSPCASTSSASFSTFEHAHAVDPRIGGQGDVDQESHRENHARAGASPDARDQVRHGRH